MHKDYPDIDARLPVKLHRGKNELTRSEKIFNKNPCRVRIRIEVSVHLGYRATRRDACPVQCQQGWEARTEQVARRALPHRRL